MLWIHLHECSILQSFSTEHRALKPNCSPDVRKFSGNKEYIIPECWYKRNGTIIIRNGVIFNSLGDGSKNAVSERFAHITMSENGSKQVS